MPEEKNLDHELLKLAAKGGRLEIETCTCRDPKWPFRLKGQSGVRAHWNPLINDGDALRLAVLMGRADRLGIQIHIVEPFDGDTDPYTCVDAERFGEFDICHGDDPFGATRRAIVEAAAAIGSRP